MQMLAQRLWGLDRVLYRKEKEKESHERSRHECSKEVGMFKAWIPTCKVDMKYFPYMLLLAPSMATVKSICV